jgi:hypothetical protein
MLGTLVGGAIALVGSVVGIVISQRLQRRGDREARILDAKVRIFGECTEALYEYERVNFGRARARLRQQPEAERETLRQEVYRFEARARAAIGQAAYLSGSTELEESFESVHKDVHALSEARGYDELTIRHEAIQQKLKNVLHAVQDELRK